MPEQDGYDPIRRLRTLPPSEGGALPMVALTAYTRAEDRAKALAAGFSTHVGKPVNPEDLVKVIARITDWKPWTRTGSLTADRVARQATGDVATSRLVGELVRRLVAHPIPRRGPASSSSPWR